MAYLFSLLRFFEIKFSSRHVDLGDNVERRMARSLITRGDHPSLELYDGPFIGMGDHLYFDLRIVSLTSLTIGLSDIREISLFWIFLIKICLCRSIISCSC